MANQRATVVVDKKSKTALLIDVAMPSDSNIRKKEHEMLGKHQRLREEPEKMWRSVNTGSGPSGKWRIPKPHE